MTVNDGRPLGLSWTYDRAELIADGIIHVLGAVAAVFAAGALVGLALYRAELATASALAVYAATLMTVLGLSAVYNMWPVSPTKWLLRRFDHAAIFLLIAGTYTPFMIHVGTPAATIVLVAVWAAALAGASLKLLLPGRFDRLAVIFYLVLAWSGLAVATEVFATLPTGALALLLAGGALYSIGVIFHLWNSLRFQNAIWHGFVLAAAGCQYGAVMSGVLFGA